jgi:hypothetical protein
MKTTISSPILARLQIMFNSGMTLQEVSEALELELVDSPPEDNGSPEIRDMVEAPSEEDGAVLVEGNSLTAETVDYFLGLINATQKLGDDVFKVAGHEKVGRSKSLSKSTKSLISSTRSVTKLVNAIASLVPETSDANNGQSVNMDDWPGSTPDSKNGSSDNQSDSRSYTAKSKEEKSDQVDAPEPKSEKADEGEESKRKKEKPDAEKPQVPASSEGKLAVPQPRSAKPTPDPAPDPKPVQDAPASPKPAPLPKPSEPPEDGNDVHSKIASALDQITQIANERDQGETAPKTKS